MTERDFTERPYTADEQRVADHIAKQCASTIGGGDDPIGFILAAHGYATAERNKLRTAIHDAIEALGDDCPTTAIMYLEEALRQ